MNDPANGIDYSGEAVTTEHGVILRPKGDTGKRVTFLLSPPGPNVIVGVDGKALLTLDHESLAMFASDLLFLAARAARV